MSTKTEGETPIIGKFSTALKELADLAYTFNFRLANGVYVSALLMSIVHDLEEQVKQRKE
jgi:hypothetical protein